MFPNFSILLMLIIQLHVHFFLFIFWHLSLRIHLYNYVANYGIDMTSAEEWFWTLLLNTDAVLFLFIWVCVLGIIFYYFLTRYPEENLGVIFLFTLGAFNGIALIVIHSWWILHFLITGCVACQACLLHTLTLCTNWILHCSSQITLIQWELLFLIFQIGCWLIFKK